MATQKTTADLAADALIEFAKTNLESITPTSLGDLIKNVIVSYWNILTNTLTQPPTSMTKAALATAIGTSALKDKQWIKITNRGDGNPLFVMAQGVDEISPFGIWIDNGSGAAQPVLMNYTAGFDGEISPFLFKIDINRDALFTGRDWTFTGRNVVLSLTGGTLTIGTGSTPISKILTANGNLTFGAVSSGDRGDQTIACTAVAGDVVQLGIPAGAMPSGGGNGCAYFAWVSAADVVTVSFTNGSGGTLTPTGGLNFKIMIIKF